MINRPSFILLNIFFLVQLCAGQADTTLLRWYPLDKGNYWQYSFYYSDWRIPEFSSGHFSMEVVGDTVMPNGKQYAIIERRSLPDTSGASYIYQRVDTTTANVYQYCAESPGGEFLIDSLASQVGDSSRAFRDGYCEDEVGWITFCQDIYIDTTLGMAFHMKDFERMGFIPSWQYTLAKGLGYISGFAAELWEYSEGLVYARIRGKAYGKAVKIISDEMFKVTSYQLKPNFPNPFNSVTWIEYYLPRAEPIRIAVYNVMGQLVQVLYSGKQTAGFHSIRWDARNLPSGVYFYSLKATSYQATRKCVVIR